MIRILHLFDESTRWEHRVALGQLLDRLPGDEVQQHVAVVDGIARSRLGLGRCAPPLFARRFGLDFVAAPSLRRFLLRRRIDLVHAWGARAAAVAEHAASSEPRPTVVTLFDPAVQDRDAALLRAVRRPDRHAILCPFNTVRRRLLEKGVDAGRCVVVHPAVDFSIVNEARGSDLRERIGLDGDHRVVVVPDPVTPTAGQFVAFWAVAIRSFLEPNLRLVLPGGSREQRRLLRLARQIDMPHLVCCPGANVPYEALVALGDLALVPAREDISGTSLAWMMAAGVAILGTAVRSVAEMLAHDHNSVLLEPAPTKRLATMLARAMDDRETLQRMAEVARGQAYERFGLRRYVDQHRQLYTNLVNGRPADQEARERTGRLNVESAEVSLSNPR